MPDGFDYHCFGCFLERILGRARWHSKRWIGMWLASVLIVLMMAMIVSAPAWAYAMLFVVLLVAIFTDADPADEA